MSMKKHILACAVAVTAACAFGGGAQAFTVFDWSYSGVGITAGGTLTASDTGVPSFYTCPDCNNGNAWLVSAITGTRNGITITGLVAPLGFAGNDNVIFPDAPYLDWAGVAYTVLGGVDYNVYSGNYGIDNNYNSGLFPPSRLGYAECGVDGGNCLTNTFALDNFTLTAETAVICPLPSGPGTIILEPWREIWNGTQASA